jgi:REP element-mobilizing transposase RayT
MSQTIPLRNGPPRRPELRRLVERQRRGSQVLDIAEKRAGFKSWNERGYLPHRDEPGLTQFITFRLADSFPQELRHEWEGLLRIEDDRERRTQLEAWLDLGRGECCLREPRVAEMVANALLKADGRDCHMHAWVIMPNHVHLLFMETKMPLGSILKRWKGATGRAANKILGRTGRPFWQPDYWDTYMRNEDHQRNAIRYIRNNPLKAGLTKSWREWRWLFIRDDP